MTEWGGEEDELGHIEREEGDGGGCRGPGRTSHILISFGCRYSSFHESLYFSPQKQPDVASDAIAVAVDSDGMEEWGRMKLSNDNGGR